MICDDNLTYLSVTSSLLLILQHSSQKMAVSRCPILQKFTLITFFAICSFSGDSVRIRTCNLMIMS